MQGSFCHIQFLAVVLAAQVYRKIESHIDISGRLCTLRVTNNPSNKEYIYNKKMEDTRFLFLFYKKWRNQHKGHNRLTLEVDHYCCKVKISLS